MIRFDHVSFHYGGEHGTGEGVDDIRLRIADGEFVVLCGASGCGKTTLTRLINGLAPHFYEGKTEGAVYVGREGEAELCVTKAPLHETAAYVGSVFQNPKSQFFNVDTTGELAFGCENMGLSREEIASRIARTKADMKLDALMDRNIFELSGGEKQQIACGSVYASDPDIYVLDEPSSNLDKKAIVRLHDALLRIKERGKTVIVSEHRLYFLTDLADRFLYLDDGRIVREFSAEEMRAMRDEELRALGLRCTSLEMLGEGYGAGQGTAGTVLLSHASHETARTVPLSRAARTAPLSRAARTAPLSRAARTAPLSRAARTAPLSCPGADPAEAPARSQIALDALDLACNRGSTRILDVERFSLPANSIIALIGDNGCGKSTLAESLCGVIPAGGSVAFAVSDDPEKSSGKHADRADDPERRSGKHADRADDPVTNDHDRTERGSGRKTLRYLTDRQRTKKSFLVMQDVNRQLFSDSVLEEVMLNAEPSRTSLRNGVRKVSGTGTAGAADANGVSEDSVKVRATEILEKLGLADVADRHPASLSGGQKQRVAIASALCAGKDILFYDEPTSGLDRGGMERFSALLKDMRKDVTASVIITHDPELILNCCTHVCHVENGRVLSLYPLNADGVRRMKYYFLSPSDESTSQKRERVSPVGKILQYAGRWKKTVFLAATLMILGSACSVVPYLFVYRLLHTLLSGEAVTLAGSLICVCGVFAFYALYAVFYVSGLHFSHKAAYHTLENIRCRLQEKIEKQPLGNILESGSGALKKLFVDDVESIELLLAHMIPEGIGNIVVAAALLLVMIWADWQMTLFAVITIGFGISASSQMYAVGMDKMGSYFAAAKRLNNTIIEYVNGMEVVRVFNRTKDAGEKYEAHVHGYRDFALYWYRVCWPWMALYGSLFSTVTLYTLPLGALLIVRGALTLSRYLLMLCFSFGLGGLLLHLLGFMGAIPQVSYKIQTLEKTIDRAPLKTGEEAFTGDSHTVTLQDVYFGYRGEEVLKGISLTAREGTMTALVGPSGSGKTTIARLLAHHYDASDGSVRIGGQDIRQMTPEAFASQIALVSQDLFLFDDTILENIRAGRPDASDEEVYEAARRAQCAEFIAALPEQYETNCGTSGAKLSGGERQRISFARAILKDAPVIILDEATAFIDPENEQRMRVAVEEMTKDKTVIMIAHRLQTITHADQIIVLNEGRVEDSGTHDELHARCALYRTLWHRSEDVADWGLKAATNAATEGNDTRKEHAGREATV